MGRRRSSRLMARSGSALTDDHDTNVTNSESAAATAKSTASKTTEVFEDEDVDMNDLGTAARSGNSRDHQGDHNDDDDDDEDSDLERLTANYRRYSETRRAYESDSDQDLVHEDGQFEDEEADFHRNNFNDIDDEDDSDSQNDNDDDDEEEDEDIDMNEEMLHNAFMSLASRLGREQAANGPAGNRGNGTQRGDGGAGADRFQFYDQLFPGASNLLNGLGGGSSTRMHEYVRALQSREDPYLTLATLNELSDRLLMMNGIISEHTVPSYDLSKALVGILGEPFFQEDLELQLVACRCIYNLLEVNENFVSNAVRAGVIEALKDKLAEISSIDLAEQALQTLEYVSRTHSTHVFRKNAVSSALMYLDFFTIHAQRKAIAIAANSVRHIKPTEFHLVEDIFPVLQRVVIEFTDNQELDVAWFGITRIIRAFRHQPENLKKLVTAELLNQIYQVLSNPDTNLSTSIRLIQALTSCSNVQEISTLIIASGKLNASIVTALSKFKKSNESNISITTLMAVPKDLMLSVLGLYYSLLPYDKESDVVKITREPEVVKNYSDIKPQYLQFVSGLFPLLIDVYSATVVYDQRALVLKCLLRIVASVPKLEDVATDNSPIISLLASIVIQNKSMVRAAKKDNKPYLLLLLALELIKALLCKASDSFFEQFEREGILADASSLSEIIINHPLYSLPVPTTAASAAADTSSDAGDKQDEESNNPTTDGEQESENGEGESQDQDTDGNISEYDDLIQHPIEPLSREDALRKLKVQEALHWLMKFVSEVDQLYLSRKASGDGSKVGHLSLLDSLHTDLSDHAVLSGYSYDQMSEVWKKLKTALFSNGSNSMISSFELTNSGIIPVIGGIFERYDSSSIQKTSFVEVFSEVNSEGESAASLLIKKLQESLTRSEPFDIVHCGLKTGENRASSLVKPVKLKMTAVEDDEGYFTVLPQLLVMVQAISTMSNVSAFLKKKVITMNSIGVRARNFLGAERPESAAEENTTPKDHPSKTGEGWYIEVLINGKPIPSDATIFGTLFKDHKAKDLSSRSDGFWIETHDVTFRKVSGDISALNFDDRYPQIEQQEFMESQNITDKDTTLEILNLLKSLHDLNICKPDVFLNFKLTAKLNRQLEEPLIVASGILPYWSIYITRKFPFLFPLETRMFFLQSTSFGYSRLVQLWNVKTAQETRSNPGSAGSNGGDSGIVHLGRTVRQKVRVDRDKLMQSCFKVMDLLGTDPSVLEVEYNDEVGTGLGPTLEFYAICSHLFAKKSLGIWRDDSLNGDNVSEYIEGSLFPKPLKVETTEEYQNKLNYFSYLGKFMARALLDSRIVDFNFNKTFFEMIALQIDQPDLELPNGELLNKLNSVDSKLASSLVYLKEHPSEVGAMGLNFTLPGSEDIELIENGSTVAVDETNVEEYVNKVLKFVLIDGIKEQTEHFVTGFSEVFQYFSMLAFNPDEITQIFGNAEEDWSYQTLLSSVHADHGYNLDSPTVQNLITVLSKLSLSDRRLLLQFLTGSPRLPIGGFKKLKPELTVVLKHNEDGLKPDDILPSVMTCANYLKLPDYSSIEVLQQRLSQAFNEGAGAFHLS
ncbi:hypothetical protein WICPIJ_006847 [Wickerhamomyces pijperi]|uniref:HECT-type E3 ubiquitin transferase n=1 Tax=Wickerhamomyces pijperi TaxID=599730 RepID=A0A9P8Q3P4_WICPI|nr:hypothetical protein WICPIJ_006847 [Wickerhamomyces pijperi]